MSRRGEEGDGVETTRGYIQVCLTFDIKSTLDSPEEVAHNVLQYINSVIQEKDYPYEKMELEHVEIEGDELDYRDWGYEDYVNYIEDTTER